MHDRDAGSRIEDLWLPIMALERTAHDGLKQEGKILYSV
jgi:hypothetical protein